LRDEGYTVVEAADSSSAVAQTRGNLDLKFILAVFAMTAWTEVIQQARETAPKSFIFGMIRYGALSNALAAQRLGAHQSRSKT
jgi:hypothetical protein